MNKYKLSALSKKGRADIFNEAERDGVIIQDCNTNGDVRREYVILKLEREYSPLNERYLLTWEEGGFYETKNEVL